MPSVDDLARRASVIHPVPARETLIVTGPERLSWLGGLVTCEIETLKPGRGSWGLCLTRQGKIQTELWAVETGDALWLSLAPETREVVAPELDRMLIMEDAELSTPEVEPAWFSLHGPEAAARAVALAERHEGRAASIDWLGLGGAALAVPRATADAVASEAGDALLSEEAWLRLRLERGFPEFGPDYGPSERPHEAGLERRAVSWTKGCYLGQEVVCMQDMRGKVKRSLRMLRIEGGPGVGVGAGSELRDAAGGRVGSITSASYSERAHGWLAMARVDLSRLSGSISWHALESSTEPLAATPWPAE